MINVVADQEIANAAYQQWVSALLSASKQIGLNWEIEGKGLIFNNYGWGLDGEIRHQVMLGVDPENNTGTVKIVQPEVSRGANGKRTLVGTDEDGHLVLLREGWLSRNKLSRRISGDEFGSLARIENIPVSAFGERSPRHWFVVAYLDQEPPKIVSQTISFALACVGARARAGGEIQVEARDPYTFGLPEKGGIKLINRSAGSAQIINLQGYVSEELGIILGRDLKKPKNNGFCVDGFFEAEKLLIEIKTGTSAHDIYEAVGQLLLYPSLINLPSDISRLLLIPDAPPLKPSIAKALDALSIEVYTYRISQGRKKPQIEFSERLIRRCMKQA